MTDKILSIIIPSYNMEAYLPKCLGSLIIEDKVLLQKLDVIVVNDGSKDRTSEIAHEFEVKYPGVFRVIDKPNGHYGSCINAALKIAIGVYVKILDADDSFDTSNFAEMLLFLENAMSEGALDNVDCLLTDYCEVDENGAVCSYVNIKNMPMNVHVDKHSRPIDEVFQMHATMYRHSILKDINYHQSEGIMYTDTEWMVYPLERVNSIYYWPKVVYKYLVARPGQSMDPEVYDKCVWQRIKMYTRMMRESFNEAWSHDSRIRMRTVSIRGVKALYIRALQKGALREVNHSLLVVDEAIEKFGPDVYKEFNNIQLLRKFNGLYFVKGWRGKKHMSVFTIAILRMTIQLFNVTKKFLVR